MRLPYALPLLAALALTACQPMKSGQATAAAETLCAPYDTGQFAGMTSEAKVDWLTQRIDRCKLDNAGRASDFYNRGVAHLELNRYQLAEADADAALALAQQDSRVFALRCLARMGLTESEGAVADCQEAVMLSSGNPVMLALYGKAQARNGQAQAARESLRAAAADAEALKAIQQELKDKGYYSGAVDGIYGKGTEGALKAWVAAGAP